jgi:dethiobiotin synthetase
VRRVKGVFVTGTDTGVGKTTVALGLVAAFRRRQLRVSVMKPCETGDGDDGERLARATGRVLADELVRPYRFALPASPAAAARAARARVDLDLLVERARLLARDCDLLVIEGAGGLLVPLTPSATVADLAGRLRLPLLVVARAALGTINHTLLTVEAIRRRRLALTGVVLCRGDRRRDPSAPTNAQAIARHGRVRVFGTLPWLPAATRASDARLAHAAEAALPLDALWRAL